MSADAREVVIGAMADVLLRRFGEIGVDPMDFLGGAGDVAGECLDAVMDAGYAVTSKPQWAETAMSDLVRGRATMNRDEARGVALDAIDTVTLHVWPAPWGDDYWSHTMDANSRHKVVELILDAVWPLPEPLPTIPGDLGQRVWTPPCGTFSEPREPK